MSTVFNRIAVDYDTFRPAYPDAVYAAIEEYAGGLSGAQVLDLAAGTGIASRALAGCGARVFAVDLGADMLAILQARTAHVAVAVARGEWLPVADGSVDVVTVASAWHWLDGERRAEEAMRVLRPGGALAIWWAVGSVENADDADREGEIYTKWRVGQRDLITQPPNTAYPMDDLPQRGYVDVTWKDASTTREVTVAEHIGHLSTHSPILALREDLGPFQQDLADLYAGRETVVERIACNVFLARKP